MKLRLATSVFTAVVFYALEIRFTAAQDDIHGPSHKNLDALSRISDRDLVDANIAPNLKRSLRLNLSTSLEDITEKFHINVNTIIRTQDSRSMGAKYLNETELPSNQDCLFWCWETPNCNVAVFEEKNKGSCYLFDCGSPADFRCKFTVHNFYTSSILLTNQHSYDLSVWGAQVKHENELARLHPTSTTIPEAISVLTSEVPAIHSAGTVEPSGSVPDSKSSEIDKSTTEKKCRHYQFQCLNSSECIAIYNVCDGIPQCPDGSDESKDLQCPESNAKPSSSSLKPHSPPSQQYKSIPPEAPPGLQGQPPVQQPVQPQDPYIYKPDESLGHIPPAPEPNLPQPVKNEMKDVSWIKDYDTHQESLQNAPNYNSQLQEGHEPHHSHFKHKHQQYVNQYPDYDSHPTMQQTDQYNPYSNNYHRLSDHYPNGDVGSDVSGSIYGRYTEQNPYWLQSEQLPSRIYKEAARTGPQVDSHPPSRQTGLSNEDDMYLPGRWPVRQTPQQMQYLDNKHASENEEPLQRVPQHQVPVQPQLPAQPVDNREDLSISHDAIPDSQDVYNLYPQPQLNSHHLTQQKTQDLPLAQSSHSLQQPSRDESSYISENMKGQTSIHKPTIKAKSEDLYQPVVEEPVQTRSPSAWKSDESVSSNKGVKSLRPSTEAFHNGASGHKPAAKTYNTLSVDQPSFAHLNEMPEGILSAAELQKSSHIHAHESNSAVLALTLGLCITALLLVLVGCRMRAIRRRLSRRGRSSLTHDADYLVNGMYL